MAGSMSTRRLTSERDTRHGKLFNHLFPIREQVRRYKVDQEGDIAGCAAVHGVHVDAAEHILILSYGKAGREGKLTHAGRSSQTLHS
jgi:hypothetical protein